jgi:hypothetical protein
MEFMLFEDAYPELDDGTVSRAMSAMDEGYLAQDYYRAQKAKISLEKGPRKETYTYDSYSWTEHISRKWGQWHLDPAELMEQLEKRGFFITRKRARKSGSPGE